MPHYKINFSGFAFIEAESEGEALNKLLENEEEYSEFYFDSFEEEES